MYSLVKLIMSTHEVSWTPSIYPNYENYEIRLKTFSDRFWPISYYQNESIMAKAGFFYSGLGDLVKCAYCGVCLHQWQPDDDPISEHKKFNKNCKFVRLLQQTRNQSTYRNYNFSMITKILFNRFTSLLQSISFYFKNIIYLYFNRSRDNRLIANRFINICKICFNDDSNMLLLPCHHISTCLSCTMCTKCCPICRCEIKHVIKIYFS